MAATAAAPPSGDGPVSFEEAEAQRAEADTWTHYSSHKGEAKEVTEDNGFAALGVPERLVERLARDGITEPFPIQAATIPDALAGRDVLGRGRTGSGKTLAFGLAMITRLADGTRPESKRPRSLILVPTRELAMQVSDALEPFVHVTGLRHKLVAGGLSYEPQIKALNKGIDILVATPGRLADLMDRGAVELGGVQIAVLDEADHMADMGFLPEVTAILDEIPAGRSAAALLGDPRQGHRHPGRPLPRRPGHPLDRRRPGVRDDDEPPRAAHRPAGQEGPHGRARRSRRSRHRLRPHPARLGPHRR